MKLLLLVLLFPASFSLASPQWASEGQRRAGNMFYVVCIGEGPAIDIARNEAINSCKATATNQFTSTTKVKTITVETEKESALHQEIEDNISVVGLICLPQNEEIEETDSHVKVYLKCKFDLSKASIGKESEPKSDELPRAVGNQDELTKLKSRTFDTSKPTYKRSATSTISVATVPQCDSLIIRGTSSRTVNCTSNPVTVVLYPDDTEIIARAHGYKSKSFTLTGKTGGELNVQIIFD